PNGSQPAWGSATGGFSLGGPLENGPHGLVQTAVRPTTRRLATIRTSGSTISVRPLPTSLGRVQSNSRVSILDRTPLGQIRLCPPAPAGAKGNSPFAPAGTGAKAHSKQSAFALRHTARAIHDSRCHHLTVRLFGW